MAKHLAVSAGSDDAGCMPRRFAVISDDPGLADGFARLADGGAAPMPEVYPRSEFMASGMAESGVELILVDLENDDDPDGTVLSLVQYTDARIVGVGTVNDVSLYRALRRLGLGDYLLKPLDDRELRHAIRMPVADLAHVAGPAGGQDQPKLTLVVGARGGVGSSSLALGVGWWIAEKLKHQVSLLDLDLTFGTSALSLDLLPGPGLRDALKHPERIDPLFVGSAMVNATDNLFLLAAEEALDDTVDCSEAALCKLVEALCETFPSIVIDVPRHRLIEVGALEDRVTAVAVVSDLSLAGLRDAIRVRDILANRFPEARVVMSATMPPGGRPVLSRREFERGLGRTLDWVIPWEAKSAARAAVDGVPLVSCLGKRHQMSKVTAGIAALAAPAATQSEPERRLWRW